MWVRDSRDDIDNIRVPGQDCGQGSNHILNSLVGRQKAKRQQDGFTFDTEPVLVIIRVHELKVGHPVRNDIDLCVRDRVHISQKLCRLLAHHNQPVGETRNLHEHRALIWVWITQNGVERGHDGHLQFAQQGEDIASRNPAVDTVFML